MKIRSNSIEETVKIGKALGKTLSPGDVIGLKGDLGAGKTAITKAIGEGMGITDLITSPTFTLVREYQNDTNLYHFDTYRLAGMEVDDLGLDDYFYGDGVCVVEWADCIVDFLPEDMLWIEMQYVDDDVRELTFIPKGKYWEEKLASMTLPGSNEE